MRSTIISTTSDHIASGGTITGDLTISGDLTVSGGGGFAYTEVISASDSGASYTQYTNSTTGSGTGDGTLFGIIGNENATIWNSEATSTIFATSDSASMTIDASGNVGIGVTPESWDTSPAYSALQIGGEGALYAQTSPAAGNGTHLTHNLYRGASQEQFITANEEAAMLQIYNGAFYFYIDERTDQTADANCSLSARMVIDDNSRISLSNNDGSGAGNTVFGSLAGDDLESGGTYNTFFGDNAGHENQLGDSNIAIGSGAFDASYINDTQDALTVNNVFIGNNAGGGTWANNASHSNVGIGNSVMDAAMDGALYNTAVGHLALSGLTTGISNVALGTQSAGATTIGDYNVAIGSSSASILGALQSNTVGDFNIAIGTGALGTANATTNDGTVAIGHLAGTVQAGTGGSASDASQVYIGYKAGTAVSTGQGNMAIGHQALMEHTTGSANIAIGYKAMDGTQDGGSQSTSAGSGNNIFIGNASGGGGWTDVASNYNVGVGHNVMDAAMDGALNNTAMGHSALSALTTGDNNVCIGKQSGGHNINLETGGNNTLIGALSDTSATSSTNQTAIGYDCSAQADNSVTLGNADVDAVYMAQDKGAKVHCAAIDVEHAGTSGYPLYVKNDGNNANRYGINIQAGADDASGTTIYINASDGDGGQVGHISNTSGTFALTDPSDSRLKKNIVDTSVKGLETVAKMKVRDFEWKKSGDKCIGGFVAQELKEAYEPAVQGTDGAVEDILDDDGKKTGERIVPMGVSRDVLVPVLVKAIQELTAKVEALENK